MAKLPAGYSRLKDGRLQLRFTFSGKRYSVCGHTVAECREKERKRREELAKGVERRKNPSVEEYAEDWEENREGKVSPATLRTQEHIIRLLLAVPVKGAGCPLGKMKIKDIEARDLQGVQRLLLAGWRPEEEKQNPNAHKEDRKRTTQTVNDYMALLRHIFKDAKRERIIDYNPVELIDNLKRTEERARDTIHRALTLKEQEAFFSCERTKTSSYYNVFRLAILSGMRCGEIGALQNGDIRGGFIYVQRTITKTSAGYCVGKDAKTAAGRRKLPLTDAIRQVLTAQRQQNTMLFGERAINPNDILFKAPKGGLLMATPLDREIRTICSQIGIEPFTLHSLRATYATRCIAGGMNPKTLQELLGHTSFSMTMDLYGHVLDDTKKEETEKIKIVI